MRTNHEITSADEVEPMVPTMQSEVDALETELISKALQRYGGNLRRVAVFLSISRSGLYKKMKRLGISAWDYR